ncbi:MAG: hypothetical protein EBR01_01015 [Proteobacteria bacterium]|nr:hypothetical protein [Pseudomonadota bacterium]
MNSWRLLLGYCYCNEFFLMKSLFYLVFIFFAALAASLFLIPTLARISQFVAWREFVKRPKGIENALALRVGFNLSIAIPVILGASLSWFCTKRFTYGFLFAAFCPLLFRAITRYQNQQNIKTLENSAVSFFHLLLGLVQSGKSLPSSLFDAVQSQTTPFTLKLRKYLGKYEEGRGLSRILIEFRNRTRLPVVGSYLTSLEMAYRQGLEVAPLLEKMIPTLETEQHFQLKVEDLRRQMLVQSALAFFMPWALAGVLWIFNPEVFASLSKNHWSQLIAAFSMLFEITGIWFLWETTRFL